MNDIVFVFVNILIYWLVVRFLILLHGMIQKYQYLRVVGREDKIILHGIIDIANNLQDYMLRHNEDFNFGNLYKTFPSILRHSIVNVIGKETEDLAINMLGEKEGLSIGRVQGPYTKLDFGFKYTKRF